MSLVSVPPFPGGDLKPPWGHQQAAYEFAYGRSWTFLQIIMGAGKTRTTIATMDARGIALAIVLCPKNVVGVWPGQLELWSDQGWIALAPQPRWPVKKRVAWLSQELRKAAGARRPVAVIVNYESSWRPEMADLLLSIAQRSDTAMVLDESHRIKSPGGRASKFAQRLGRRSDLRLALTGTIMPHDPMDLYAQFRAMDRGATFGTSFTAFRARYAVLRDMERNGRTVKLIKGFQNMDELHAKLGANSVIVTKEDANLDLPPTLHIPDTTMAGRPTGLGVFDLEPKSQKAYDVLNADLILGVQDGTVTVQNALTKLLRLQQVTSGFVRTDDGLDRQVGTEKLDVLADLLEDLDPAEPVTIFARFVHDIEAIGELCRKMGRRVGFVDGRHHLPLRNNAPLADRDKPDGLILVPGTPDADYGLTAHSKMREDIDVCVLQLQAGGVGIDLSRSAFCVYYSLEFSLGNYLQSLARTDRPGQTRPVTYVHLIARGTIDETVYGALRKRQAVVDTVLNAARIRRG